MLLFRSLPETICYSWFLQCRRLIEILHDLALRNARTLLCLVMVHGLSMASSYASGFATVPTFAAGSRPFYVAVGDFNGDGIPDLVVADYSDDFDGGVSTLLGNGDGTFQAPTSLVLGSSVYSVVVADFNGDGHLDLAVTGGFGLNILLGKGDGTFQVAGNYVAGDLASSGVAVGDFNGDGIPDLAVASSYPSTVSILLGNGDGSFLNGQTYAVGANPMFVAVGDFNRDGNFDLAVANSDGTVSILLGNGTGSFQAAQNYAVGGVLWSIAVGDLNEDGIPDLVVADYGGDGENAGMSILLGNGDGTFQIAQSYTIGFTPSFVVLGDFNADGHLGIAIVLGSIVLIQLGNGDSTFQAPVLYATGSGGTAVAIGDFNGDGIPDLAVADAGDNTVSILIGKGDGSFQAARCYPYESSTVAVTGFSGHGIAVADFNGDGIPDLAVANGTRWPCCWATATAPFSRPKATLPEAIPFLCPWETSMVTASRIWWSSTCFSKGRARWACYSAMGMAPFSPPSRWTPGMVRTAWLLGTLTATASSISPPQTMLEAMIPLIPL